MFSPVMDADMYITGGADCEGLATYRTLKWFLSNMTANMLIKVTVCNESRVTHCTFNTLRPRQNGRRFADDTFKCIFLNENVRISIKI